MLPSTCTAPVSKRDTVPRVEAKIRRTPRSDDISENLCSRIIPADPDSTLYVLPDLSSFSRRTKTYRLEVDRESS